MMSKTLKLMSWYVSRVSLSGKSYSSIPVPEIDCENIILRSDYFKNILKVRKATDKINLIDEVLRLSKKSAELSSVFLKKKMMTVAAQLPNDVHPDVLHYKSDYELVKSVGQKRIFKFKPAIASDILQEKDLLRMSNLNLYSGEKSYYFIRDLAKVEQALVNYTVQKLLNNGFELLSVPDIIPEYIIENCGLPTNGERTMLYRLKPNTYHEKMCLSGTSEMAIAALMINSNIPCNLLPRLYTAVSRCYRAEISNLSSERGLYRVHQFTKVEMFGVCKAENSAALLEDFRKIQENLFRDFELHYRVIDMAPSELGHHSYRKYDIEAWMPGMNRFGELSSCSNCVDFQSRRLSIKDGNEFLHTVNGTACAIPRTLSAIIETHQDEKGRVLIPQALRSFMNSSTIGLKRGPNTHKILSNVIVN